jgi:predicted nucleic acid-binding protein
MKLVVDASVALKWVLSEPGTEAALALRSQELMAPALWFAEATNALWRRVRLGEVALAEAAEFLDELIKAPVVALAMEPHLHAALALATELQHPIYDCLYLTVALHHDAYVVTADRRFVAAVAESEWAERVRLLGHTS